MSGALVAEQEPARTEYLRRAAGKNGGWATEQQHDTGRSRAALCQRPAPIFRRRAAVDTRVRRHTDAVFGRLRNG